MELRHLRYFVAVAEAPTMAQAAEQVFVTQSTLSHQLAQLEGELGAPLFERVGRTLQITPAGRELLGHARGVLAQVQEGIDAVTRTQSSAVGTLRVGVIHSFVTHLMPQVAAAFMREHPQARLQIGELTGVEIEAQVGSGLLDLGVAFYPPMSDAVQGERLFDDTLVLAVPTAHPLAQRRSVRFAQLADLPLAMLSQRFATRRLLDDHFRRAGVLPQVVVEIDSVDALERLVAHGTAAAFLPGRSTQATAHIHLLQVTHPSPVRAAGLVWRRSGYRSTAAKGFVSVLQQTV